ncbi:MAG: hypothetical protein ABUK01_15790 [Leptospirales bacterium]
MLELKDPFAEEMLLKILVLLEKRVKNHLGLEIEEVKKLYNELLHESFTRTSVTEYLAKKA